MTDQENRNQLHLHVAGMDRPGILADVLGEIVEHECLVVDIKQFVFNGLLNLSLLVESRDNEKLTSLNQTLLEANRIRDCQVRATPWDRELRPEEPYCFRQVVTLLGRRLGSVAMAELTATLASLDLNILRIEQLDYSDHHVLEFVIGSQKPMAGVEVLDALVSFKEQFEVDLAVQEDSPFRRNKRLIVMDADMTFLQCEVIDELGKVAGCGEQLGEITRAAMNGDVDFAEALKRRVALLKGLTVDQLNEVSRRIPLTPGAEALVGILKKLGYKIAIVSGGFRFFIDRFKETYGLDYGFANELEIVDGKVTGNLVGDIVDAQAKRDILLSLASREGLAVEQVVAVGDGANDIQMLAGAGLGIAFNAKPIVAKHARASLTTANLEPILYFLGIPGKEIEELRQMSRKVG